jgi:hypothetical protein
LAVDEIQALILGPLGLSGYYVFVAIHGVIQKSFV